MLNKIPTTVITGFLGAGKTTLIKHLINNAGDRKIALIINEFGDLGVDGDILKGCNDEACNQEDIIELSNGCICCTVADDFIPTIEKLLDRNKQLDHILIETSGLALPQPLLRAFKWPEIQTRVTVDGVITVVDGKAVTEGRFANSIEAVDNQRKLDENLDHETPLSELFEDQITCADMIVINKSDLLTSSQIDDLLNQLKKDSREGVQVLKSEMGMLPTDVLLGQQAVAEEDIERIMQHPATAIGSDGTLTVFGAGAPHPRQYGTFARVLGRYVRERGIITLENAVRKMSGATAQRLGIRDRGILREGYFADISIFNAAEIRDMATFEDPHQYAEGVDYVIINGTLALDEGIVTAARPGQIINGPGFQED